MIAPASTQLAEEFGITSNVLMAMATSVFVLGYGESFCRVFLFVILNYYLKAIGPLFLGPLSELYGRSRVLQIANLWYLGTSHTLLCLIFINHFN